MLGWAVAVAIGAVAIRGVRLGVREPPNETVRLMVAPPTGTLIPPGENSTRIALSPDGRHLAFVGSTNGQQRIWVRPLGSLAARPLEGTDGGLGPFWSPDSRFVGYLTNTAELKKVDISGGPPRVICAARVEGTPAWGADGTIIFNQFLDGIYRVSSEGGTPVRVTSLDKSRRELNHFWPSFLPDGRYFLFTATALDPRGIRVTPSVYIASLDSTEVTLLAQIASKMVYAAGHLLFVEEGALMAQVFDPATLKLRGEPVRIAEGLGYIRTLGNAAFSASTTGVLAYQGPGDPTQFVWYDRPRKRHANRLGQSDLRRRPNRAGWATRRCRCD